MKIYKNFNSFAFVCSSLFFITFQIHALETNAVSAVQETPSGVSFSDKNIQVLAPIRRIGLDVVETNIDEFRTYMHNHELAAHGVPSLAFSEQEVKSRLSQDFEKQIEYTGRFWEISLSNFLETSPDYLSYSNEKSLTEQKILILKKKLNTTYYLDSWLSPRVYFAPDQTLVRVLMKDIQSEQTLAREDILLEAQASERKISAAFAEALTRLMTTIGHDGKVTYMRDNLMTVDFGSETGIKRGQKIMAGYVILSGVHPKSGEYLRRKRVPLYELTVLEAKKGSSLCQITAMDKIQLETLSPLAAPPRRPLLAWLPKTVDNLAQWNEPYDPETAPILGAEDTGFGVPVESDAKTVSPPKDMAQPGQDLANSYKSQLRTAGSQNSVASNEGEIDESTNNPTFADLKAPKRFSHLGNPGTWELKDLSLGLGTTLGSSVQGQSSSFPSSAINNFNGLARIYLDDGLNLMFEPFVNYSFFTGNSVSGSSYYFDTKLYLGMLGNKTSDQCLYFGVGGEFAGGTIDMTSSSMSFNMTVINPSVLWKSRLVGVGEYAFSGDFSIVDLVKSVSTWTVRTRLRPYEFVLPQIAFDLSLKRFNNQWIEFQAGVSWEFASNMSSK